MITSTLRFTKLSTKLTFFETLLFAQLHPTIDKIRSIPKIAIIRFDIIKFTLTLHKVNLIV